MNEAQEARRIAVIALAAVLATAAVTVIHVYKAYEEDKVIAANVSKHFEFFDQRLQRLEKKVQGQ